MRKKILHIITGLEVGGAETNLYRLIPSLEKKFENRVCCLTGQGKMGKKIESIGIPVYYLKITSVFDFINPKIIWKFRSLVKNFKPDILETYLIHSDLFGRIWGKIFRIKKIICSHRGSLLRWEWLSFFDKITSFLVNKYVFQTSAAQREMIKKLGISSKKTIVIPNAINTAIFNFRIEKEKKIEELGIKKGNFNISIVSNLRQGKGHQYLISAFEKVFLSHRKDINLIIVGAGDQRPILENQANISPARNNIYFLGERNDVVEILKISDIFVLPTFYEGMSNAIMEAMAAGLPVITTRIDVTGDLIEDGFSGILVPVKDFLVIAKNLKILLDNPDERLRLGENALKKIRENFSREIIAEKVENLFLHI